VAQTQINLAMAQPQKFVLIAAPRTGSNWVCSMLNSHPEILCHHEIFNPEGIHYALDHRTGDLQLGTVAERDAAPLDFLARLWPQHFNKRVVGFKFNRGQHEAVLRHVLTDRSVRKIVLTRRNRIKTFVSEMIAAQTGQWESYGLAAGDGLRVRLAVDAQAFRAHVALNRAYYAHIERVLRSSGQDYLPVTYERLQTAAEWLSILQFLNVTPQPAALSPGTRKQNSSDLRDLLANFAQLETALKGSEFEAELYEREL
jgi:LPS sulfotransferase NodH